MSGRVPVLRENDMFEAAGKQVDRRNDFVAARHGKKAAGTEIILNVDDQKDIVGLDRDVFWHGPFTPVLALPVETG